MKMLDFSNCSKEIQKEFATEFVSLMKRLDIKSVPANCYDKDLPQKIQNLCQETATGFVFDELDLIGVEPYGYVSDFFEAVLRLVRQLKDKHIEIGITGHFMMLDLGSYECILRQRVEAKENEPGCMCYDQVQCVCCYKWVDLKDAHELLYEEEIIWTDDELDTVLYPSAYANGDDGATFCICSEECERKLEGDV
jgi:hypothetical protein